MTSIAGAALSALGDPVRRRILVALSAGELPVGEVVAALRADAAISQPAVSQHLKVLHAAGLVRVRPDGRRRLHAIEPAGIAAARAWLDALADPLRAFQQPLDALATEVARGRRRAAATAPSLGSRSASA